MGKYLLMTFVFQVWGLNLFSQTVSDFIVVDQFGYLPDAPKIAVIRNPQAGFDADKSFSAGASYELIDAESGETVFSGSPQMWNGGSTDSSSGDQVWWFNFSSVANTGSYYVLDVARQVRSFTFKISPSVYNEVLKHAVRTFFYQRSGFAKEEPFAEPGWADDASHIGDLQDTEARLFSDPDNSETARDVSGGWYDAGDYNKYTNWTASYVIEMMYAFKENPEVWTDDFNLPESGNDIPDLLDEAKWGLDHLLRMQNADGSVLSVVGVSHGSPPSSATGQSLYGPANTSATLTTSAAFAISSGVYAEIGMTEFADLLKEKAIDAWNWAAANPEVIFKNNDAEYGSQGLAAGQQEVDDYGRLTKRILASVFLFELTGDEKYRDFFDSHYSGVNMMQWNYVFPFQSANQDMLLYYTSLSGATESVASDIKNVYDASMVQSSDNHPAYASKKDPYLAYIKDYVWGSNAVKCHKGNMFLNMSRFQTGSLTPTETANIALGYINYLHGVNPLNFVYLSNMFKYGAQKGVTEFYHTWFQNGSEKWDKVGKSIYGPAPGFLVGGPNPYYDWDGCCPGSCGSAANNQACYAEEIYPPKDQPDQKSYRDFNNSWPLNSWSVTENSCGYQLAYIRLLANFVDFTFDCNGVKNGDALIDVCGICSGGITGREPVLDPSDCETNSIGDVDADFASLDIWPNPVSENLFFSWNDDQACFIKLVDQTGVIHLEKMAFGKMQIDVSFLGAGSYFVIVENSLGSFVRKILIQR